MSNAVQAQKGRNPEGQIQMFLSKQVLSPLCILTPFPFLPKITHLLRHPTIDHEVLPGDKSGSS